MSTVVIIGAGEIGGAVAQALAARDSVRRIVLVEDVVSVAAGKALDIQQSGAIDGFHTRLTATNDLTSVTGATACIVADRSRSPASEWQGEEGLAMLGRLVPYMSGAPLIFAGAQQAELMDRAARELGVRREQLIGSAPEALASALRAIVALEAQCSPIEIALAVLGAPADAVASGSRSGGFVVPWSEASIGGYALERVLSQVQISRVEARAARLWPPGPCTLGVAAAAAAEAVITSSRRRLSALTMLGGEFGVRSRIGAVPVLLNKRGIADVHVPALNTKERVQLETALGS